MEFFTVSTSYKFASFFGPSKNVFLTLDKEFNKVPGVKPWSRPNSHIKTEFVLISVERSYLCGYFNYVNPEKVDEIKRVIEGIAGDLMTRITVRKRSTDNYACVEFYVYNFTYEELKNKYFKNKILWERIYSKWEPHMYKFVEEVVTPLGLFYA